MWAHLSFVLSQITRLTDGQTDSQMDIQTDGQTAFSWLVRAGIPCSAVKKLDSVGYIFVADTVGLASVSLNL